MKAKTVVRRILVGAVAVSLVGVVVLVALRETDAGRSLQASPVNPESPQPEATSITEVAASELDSVDADPIRESAAGLPVETPSPKSHRERIGLFFMGMSKQELEAE